MAPISNVPFRSALANIAAGLALVTPDWRRWLQEVKDGIDAAARRVGVAVGLADQSTSVSGTVDTPTLAAGLYRVSWLLEVTQAATTSSSVQLTVITTSGGVVTTQTGDALTANTVGAALSGVFVVSVDAGTPISYTLTYVSVGATALEYGLSLSPEVLP